MHGIVRVNFDLHSDLHKFEKIEIIRIKSVFDKNKNHVEKVVDLITTWFFSIYIIVVSFYCARVGCDSKSL